MGPLGRAAVAEAPRLARSDAEYAEATAFAGAAALALADAAERFREAADPKALRETWKRRIAAAVGLPADGDWWVAGKVAGLLVAGRIEPSRIEGWIGTVSRRRRLPPGDPNAIGRPEAWFQRVVARLCSERGLPFAKSRIIQEKAK